MATNPAVAAEVSAALFDRYTRARSDGSTPEQVNEAHRAWQASHATAAVAEFTVRPEGHQWTRAEIGAMSLADFTANEASIDQAMRTGSIR